MKKVCTLGSSLRVGGGVEKILYKKARPHDGDFLVPVTAQESGKLNTTQRENAVPSGKLTDRCDQQKKCG